MPACNAPPAAGGLAHDWFVWLLSLAAVGLFRLITEEVWRGEPRRAAIASFVTSPVALTLAAGWEGRPVWQVLAPDKQAPVVLVGDTLLLPAIFWLVAAVRRNLPLENRERPGYRRWAAYVVGVDIAIWFHANEAKVYDQFQLNSPSKLTHDLLSVPTLVSAVVFALVALMYTLVKWWRQLPPRSRWYGMVALGLFAVFVVLLLLGSAGVNPSVLHPQWDWNTLHVLHCRP